MSEVHIMTIIRQGALEGKSQVEIAESLNIVKGTLHYYLNKNKVKWMDLKYPNGRPKSHKKKSKVKSQKKVNKNKPKIDSTNQKLQRIEEGINDDIPGTNDENNSNSDKPKKPTQITEDMIMQNFLEIFNDATEIRDKLQANTKMMELLKIKNGFTQDTNAFTEVDYTDIEDFENED